MDKKLRSWQIKTLLGVMFCYGTLYMLRHNFSMAQIYIEKDLELSRNTIGMILSIASIVYGIGKIVNGYLADYLSAKKLLTVAMLVCIAVNFGFGLLSNAVVLGTIWVIGYWFQSIGWPTCAKLLGLWFSRTQLGTIWAIATSSHMIGTAVVAVFAGYVIKYWGWQYVFIFPAIFALFMVILVYKFIEQSPQAVGIDKKTLAKEKMTLEDDSDKTWSEVLVMVMKNTSLWLVSFSNMCIYIIRIGILNWAPTFLKEAKEMEIVMAGWQYASYEISGVVGGLIAGLLSDRVFKGNRSIVNIFYIALLFFVLLILWQLPQGSKLGNMVVLFFIGFLIYGIITLQGVSAIEFSGGKAMATASGFLGSFGAAGSFIAGIGISSIQVKWGWNATFIFFAICAGIALVFTIICFFAERKKLK